MVGTTLRAIKGKATLGKRWGDEMTLKKISLVGDNDRVASTCMANSFEKETKLQIIHCNPLFFSFFPCFRRQSSLREGENERRSVGR